MSDLYIIAGCNGAGKTTASYTILPEILNCKEFVNADEIAKGLSPFQPEKISFEAGRIMLKRINDLVDSKTDFAFETTLSTRSYTSLIKKARSTGYQIRLIFFWLRSPEVAKQRVNFRVQQGGHSIPEETITRRYHRGLKNLFELFIPLVDEWILIDNNDNKPDLIAQGSTGLKYEIKIPDIWDTIKGQINGRQE